MMPSKTYPHMRISSLFGMYYMYVPPITNYTIAHEHAQLFECVLYFCVRNYTATMTSGQLNETIIDSWPKPDQELQHEPNIMSYLECLTLDLLSCKLSHQNYTLRPPSQEISFSVGVGILRLLQVWFQSMMKFSYDTYDEYSDPEQLNNLSRAFYEGQTTGLPSRNVTLDDAWDMPGPGVVLESIANSMTAQMRSLSKTADAAVGRSYSTRSAVVARWAWVSVPITLLVLTFGLVFSTIILSEVKQIPLWKSSSLAALLHGLDEDTCLAISAERFHDMEANAKRHVMQMKQMDNRWKLQGASKCLH